MVSPSLARHYHAESLAAAGSLHKFVCFTLDPSAQCRYTSLGLGARKAAPKLARERERDHRVSRIAASSCLRDRVVEPHLARHYHASTGSVGLLSPSTLVAIAGCTSSLGRLRARKAAPKLARGHRGVGSSLRHDRIVGPTVGLSETGGKTRLYLQTDLYLVAYGLAQTPSANKYLGSCRDNFLGKTTSRGFAAQFDGVTGPAREFFAPSWTLPRRPARLSSLGHPALVYYRTALAWRALYSITPI